MMLVRFHRLVERAAERYDVNSPPPLPRRSPAPTRLPW